jgi:hypothetical protein
MKIDLSLPHCTQSIQMILKFIKILKVELQFIEEALYQPKESSKQHREFYY